MKKGLLIALGAVVVIGLILFSFFGGTYNTLVQLDEKAKSQWSQVENVYQRRLDLIPNLVNTVKGYANFEKDTLTQVIEARTKATSVNVNSENLTPDSIAKFQQAQSGLSSALGLLMVVVEKYPDLKANQNFLELQSQLEGTENRIAVERKRFNEVVQEFNTYFRKFPNNIIGGMMGFETKGYFKADEAASKAPTVSFEK
ncbi:MAG: LemA family protein [Candidatus Caenarcaniphilales bacterium]|nr:LemA family protein [Candidatus Caenarcaniphilales bacterium]